jgi:Flp pilus assembly CpaE family ATPase
MFSSILIGSDSVHSLILRGVAVESQRVAIHRCLEKFPLGFELVRMLHSVEPDVAFVDLTDREAAMACAVGIREHCRTCAVIGVGGDSTRQALPSEMPLAAVLAYPPTVEHLLLSVDLAVHRVKGKVQENLLAFLPAKAGSGSTTVAMHVAVQLAEMGRKVLLVDADLRSGVLGFMLGWESNGSVQELLAHSFEIDTFQWQRCVVKVCGMNVLLSKRGANQPLPSWDDYFRLLEFAEPLYDDILVDLPELVNPATAEVVRRARLTCVVCAPELPPLRLAAERVPELVDKWGVADARIGMVINRGSKTHKSDDRIQQILKRPIMACLPDEPAAWEPPPLRSDSPLRQAIRQFAGQLTGEEETVEAATRATGFFGKRKNSR